MPTAPPTAASLPTVQATPWVDRLRRTIFLLVTGCLGVLVAGCGGDTRGPATAEASGWHPGGVTAAQPADSRAFRLSAAAGSNANDASTLYQPANGQVIVQSATPFRWNAVSGAVAYYLWVGTSPGTKDVINSGELAASQLALNSVTLLPRETPLFARLYYLMDGRWRFDADVAFSVSTETADLLYPTAGAVLTEASMALPFRWQASPSATAYYLFVGTRPGLFDVINSGEIAAPTTTREMLRQMPVNTWLYARLHVLEAGVWRSSKDVPFRVMPVAAVLSSPANRSLLIGTSLAVSWEAAPQAQSYRVELGSSIGASDLGSSGLLGVTSKGYTFSGPLPQGKPLFIRLYSLIGEEWRFYRDREVALAAALPTPELIHPLGDTTVVDPARPIAWVEVPGAQAYRLRIGAAAGGGELHDSGLIETTLRFVPGLPTTGTLHGTLQVLINGSWIARTFAFQAGPHSGDEGPALEAVVQALRQARGMASETHDTRPGSLVEQIGGGAVTSCTGYASSMVTLMQQMNLPLPTRMRNICLIAGSTECHTLVEVQSASSGQWAVFDPTFVASPVDRSSRQRLSTAEMSLRVRSQAFDSIDYEGFDALATSRLLAYYVDYALLFTQPAETLGTESWPIESVLGHFLTLGAAVQAQQGLYALRCASGLSAVTAIIDDVARTLSCEGIDHLSSIFHAASVQLTGASEGSATLLEPRRYTLEYR